jgi:urease accessory protein
MRARTVLTVERGPDGRSLVRELRSQSPLSLVPRRGTAAAGESAVTVHMVGSASTPVAGDDVELDVGVGPGADLVLTGVAAAVALPGLEKPSSLTIRFEIGEDASLQYLPEPTVITARAHHHTALHARLHPTARLRTREVLVAGRAGESSGRYRGTTRVEEASSDLHERHFRSYLAMSRGRCNTLILGVLWWGVGVRRGRLGDGLTFPGWILLRMWLGRRSSGAGS